MSYNFINSTFNLYSISLVFSCKCMFWSKNIHLDFGQKELYNYFGFKCTFAIFQLKIKYIHINKMSITNIYLPCLCWYRVLIWLRVLLQDVKRDGNDGSYSECYMKEHPGVSIEQTREHISKEISYAWKRLNKECLTPNPLPSSFTKICLNAARMVPLMYSYDNNSPSKLEEYVKSLLYIWWWLWTK